MMEEIMDGFSGQPEGELRRAVADVINAIIDKGSHPEYHDMIMERHRLEWPILWKRLDELKKKWEGR